MKILQNIFYWIFVTVIVAVVGLFVVSLLKIPGNVEIKIVKSGSMEPVIKTGGIVVIKPENTYNVGDVITFGEDSKTAVPTTHRIIAIRQDAQATYYTTKGDANNAPEQNETEKRNVIGKVLFTVPYAGYVLNFAKQPLGFGLLIALPAAMIIFYELGAIWEEVRRIRRGKNGQAGGRRAEYGRRDAVVSENSPYRNLELRRQRIMGMSDVRRPVNKT